MNNPGQEQETEGYTLERLRDEISKLSRVDSLPQRLGMALDMDKITSAEEVFAK
jgi:hypothetical protein